MNSDHIPSLRDSALETPKELQWLEICANIACWVGITGIILLISKGIWAAPGRDHQNYNPFTGTPPSSPDNRHLQNTPPNYPANAGSLFDDDEDDFDDPAAGGGFRNQWPSGATHGSGSPKSFSVGGSPSNVPNPVRNDSGIAVGGAPANGLISKGDVPTIRIDDETAEGSKDIVTDFNFPDADILDIAKTLGKLTGKNFILDKDVKGRITIISNSPITVSEAWKVFLTALDINGFALIPSGKYLRIARQRDARDKQLKTYTGEFSPDTDALITRVFPLKYISAEEVARTFRSFMPANSRIIPYEQTNTVIVTDTGSNIAKLAKMLEILDVEGYDAGIEVVPVKYASAAELSKLINELLPGTALGGPGGGASSGPARFGGGGRFSARRTKEGGVINTIIADERTNTLILHANGKGADQVRELVAKLDQKPVSTGGGKVHVVYLQFADAEQLANTLNNFSQGNIKGGGGSSPGGSASGTGINPIAASLFEGSIKIAADKATNALVITASPTDYVTVRRVINRLDVPRDQVYVEVVIMEVTITRGYDYSANLISTPSMMGSITSGDLASFIQSPLTSTGGLIGLPLGNQTSMPVPGGGTVQVSSVMGLIRALQSTGSANVLATPQIIAVDNAEATFESTEKIPVPTNTVTATGLSQSGFNKEPVTLSIKVKPQINKITNFVKLEVTAKLADISNAYVPTEFQGKTFSSSERSAQTTVIVGDSDSVVLGGLIRDKINDSVTKIPLLGDIPLLGWLFKSRKTSVDKRNLLIFMTPHIVKQYEKVRAILDKKLRERDEFLESNAGGEDPLKYERDAIIRSLPDVKELAKKQPDSSITIDEERPAAAVSPNPEAAPANAPNTPADPSGNPSSSAVSPPPVSAPGQEANPEDRATPSSPPETAIAPADIPPQQSIEPAQEGK